MNLGDFKNISYCEYMIVSEDVHPEVVSQLLGINPHRFHTKGDMYVSRTIGSLNTRPNNLWSVQTEKMVSKKDGINEHIEYIKSLLEPKMDLIAKLKCENLFKLIFWVWIETEDAGIGLELSSEELDFINKISHILHFSILTNQEITRNNDISL